jgi:DNA polymerase-3 subunit gamma/tau
MDESSSSGLFGDDPSGSLGPETDGKSGYLVLARKYRPRTFEDLIGQEAMVGPIAQSFALGRIAHATMFTGVRGVGKTTTARLLARALNYKRGDIDRPTIELDPPGEHCQAIMESRHPDVFEMDAASRTGIGDIREILDSVRYAPVMARYKIYIIDEVHMLSTQAFNGLLKTLEEPPPHVKFMFATTEIRKVPVTVLSRCQRFDLKRVEGERLSNHLANICAKEGVKVSTDGLALIARAAEGSVRDALSLLDQALVQKEGAEVSAADVRDMLGLADRARVLDLFDAIARGDAKTALTEVRDQYDHGADPGLILRDLLEIGHDAARAQALGADARLLGGADWTARVRGLADKLSPAQLSRLWQMLLKAVEEAGRAPDPIAAVEMAMVRLCAAQSLPPPEEAARLLRDGVRTAGASASEAPSGGADGPKLKSFEDLVALVDQERQITLQLDLERFMRVTHFAPGDIRFAPEPNMPADLPRRLIQFLRDFIDEEWRVRPDQTAPAAPVESLAERRKREEQREIDEISRHPFVAEALKHFPGAKIVSIGKDEPSGPADIVQMPSSASAPMPQNKNKTSKKDSERESR